MVEGKNCGISVRDLGCNAPSLISMLGVEGLTGPSGATTCSRMSCNGLVSPENCLFIFSGSDDLPT